MITPIAGVHMHEQEEYRSLINDLTYFSFVIWVTWECCSNTISSKVVQ